MHNPLNIKYASVRKAKKAYKKYVGKDFPRWYIYKNWFIRLVRHPSYELPNDWKWLKETNMFIQFEKSFMKNYLHWSKDLIDTFHKNGNTLF